MYNKVRKASHTAVKLPKAQAMRYVPYEATTQISQTPKRRAQLEKSRLIQKWCLVHHHYILFWGFDNIYKTPTLGAPKGIKFTIFKVIMTIELVQVLITSLFVEINVSPESDVVIICNISMKEEAEALFSHFVIYAAVIFGSIVREAFTILPHLLLCHQKRYFNYCFQQKFSSLICQVWIYI